MFEQFVKRPFHLALYRNGSYAEERSRFLAQLVQEGRCLGRLKGINWLLLAVANRVDLSGDRSYTADALKSVAERWQRTRGSRSRSKRQARIAILDFVFVASSWMRFLGRFKEKKEELPYGEFLGEFFAFLSEERGLAKATIRGHKHSLKLFLSWLKRKHIQLTAVSPKTISTYFTSAVAGRWKRVTVSHHVQSVRTFSGMPASEAGVPRGSQSPSMLPGSTLMKTCRKGHLGRKSRSSSQIWQALHPFRLGAAAQSCSVLYMGSVPVKSAAYGLRTSTGQTKRLPFGVSNRGRRRPIR